MLLNYDAEQDIWTCPLLWMSDATFKRYIDVWLESAHSPTREDLLHAVSRCRRVGYWIRGADPEVHWLA